MANNHRKKLNRSPGGDFAMFSILLLFALFMAVPFVYTIGNSLKPVEELWAWPPTILPKQITFNNFSQLSAVLATSDVPFSRYLYNTVMISVIGTAAQIVLSALCAYSVSLYKFPGSKAISNIVRLALMFNAGVLAVPTYMIVSKLHLIDNYWAYILPACGAALGLYLMCQFMGQIPYSIIEAARIDGAGHLRVFWKIVMPQVKSAWLTLLIFSFNSLWNTMGSPYIYSEKLKLLYACLSQIQGGGLSRVGISYATSVIMMSVPIVIFVVTQSNVIETMATSGMKD